MRNRFSLMHDNRQIHLRQNQNPDPMTIQDKN